MDKLAHYREIVERVLTQYTEPRYTRAGVTNEAVFDRERDRYLVVSVGWQGNHRVQHGLIHLDIINDKIWVQGDNTEYGVTYELEEAGVPKSDIVLAFHHEADRPHTGYAVA